MNSSVFHCIFFSVFLLFFFTLCEAQQKHSFTRQKMGAPFTIVVYHDDEALVDSMVRKAFDEVDRLIAIFSDYDEDSELNQLSGSSGLGVYYPVSPELFDILKISRRASRLTGGAFDVTIGPLTQLWRELRNNPEEWNKIVWRIRFKSVGYKRMILNEEDQSVWLKKQGMLLDLGGIAKGYIAQKILDELSAAGLSQVLVNAGGDMAMGNPPPEREGWEVGISTLDSVRQLMNRRLLLSRKAVATSGDSFRHLDYNGKRYSHIINPKNGQPITYHRNVTVIANDGTTADWVASACSVMKLRQIKRLMRKLPDVSVMVTERKEGRLQQLFYNGFERYLE